MLFLFLLSHADSEDGSALEPKVFFQELFQLSLGEVAPVPFGETIRFRLVVVQEEEAGANRYPESFREGAIPGNIETQEGHLTGIAPGNAVEGGTLSGAFAGGVRAC